MIINFVIVIVVKKLYCMNIDIDVDDVLWSMSRFEKREMLSALIDEMDIEDVTRILEEQTDVKVTPNITSKMDDEDFHNKVLGLLNNRFKLTNDEEDFIVELSKRINP